LRTKPKTQKYEKSSKDDYMFHGEINLRWVWLDIDKNTTPDPRVVF
jgi:hypothetical protein